MTPKPDRNGARWYGLERALAWVGALLGGLLCIPTWTRFGDAAVFENGKFQGLMTLGFIAFCVAAAFDGARWLAKRKSGARTGFPALAFVGGYWAATAALAGLIIAFSHWVLSFYEKVMP